MINAVIGVFIFCVLLVIADQLMRIADTLEGRGGNSEKKEET